jgi:paired amphipathic helix protein Sin3a
MPTLLYPNRLQQKDDEWRRVRFEMKAQWRKINETNYARSLDHRSFYFKQEVQVQLEHRHRNPQAVREANLITFRSATLTLH